MNSRSTTKSNDKYSKENFCNDKHGSQKHETGKSRSVSSSHVRRKSPLNRDRNSKQEYDHLSNVDEKSKISENRRVVYRTEDRGHDRYKSDKSHSRDNRHKALERYHSSEKESNHDAHNSSTKNHRSLEDVRNHDQVDMKLTYNVRRSRSRSPKTDYHKHSDSRSLYLSPNRHERLTSSNKSSELWHRGSSDFHSFDESKHYRDKRHENNCTEKNNYDRSRTYINDSSCQNNDYHVNDGRHVSMTNDERHISYKNTSAASEHDEFVASLLQKIEFLNNQIAQLAQENEKLKFSSKEEPTAEISIKFGNKRFEEKFSSILKDLATDLITGRCSIEALSSFIEATVGKHLQSESWNLEGELFSLDNSCEEPKESSSVPRYDKGFSKVLQNSEFLKENEAADDKREPKITKICFNCDGDHFINECKLPLNKRKIAIARRKKQSTFVPNKRYHICENQHSKFKPGVISQELRKALDLHENQIPAYIYRMRILDYPPGWQAEAVIESSGIALYDSEGIAEFEEKSKKENSECAVQYDPDKLIDFPGFNVPITPDFIDESDALGYPPLQLSQLRVCVEKNLPKPELPSRKRKLDLPLPKSAKVARLDESMDLDEDLDSGVIELKEFQPPLPDDKLPPPPPECSPSLPPSSRPMSPEYSPFSPTSSPTSTKIENERHEQSEANSPMLNPDSSSFAAMMEPLLMFKEDSSQSSGDASPSLMELEEMKKRLVMELSIETESSSPAVPIGSITNEDDTDSLKTVVSEHYGTLENSNEFSNLSDSSFSSKASNSENSASCKLIPNVLPRTDSIGSKLVSLGTPSISRHSSYTKLPNYENFSKDVTSHMNFENLPNSTGTYQRMKKVIKKVKDKLNSMIH